MNVTLGLPRIIEIAEEKYEFVYIKDDFRREAAAGLAVECLGALGDETVVPVLNGIYDKYGMTRGDLGESAAYSLYRLGYKNLIEEREKQLQSSVDGGLNVLENSFALAVLFVKTNQIDKAIAQFESIIPQVANFFPTLGNVNYNLACLYSTKKNTKKALECLRLAVENGYDDYEWITMDGDMKPLMKEPEFDEIVSKIKRSLPGKNKTDKKTSESPEIY